MRSMRVVAFAVTGMLLFGVLAFAAEPRPVRPSYNHFTDGDEERIGAAMAQKIEKEGVRVPGPDGRPETARIQRNMLLETYLESIASKLGQASRRPEISYTVRVIDAPNIANAMSIPGGHIYIYSGLLEFVRTEGELSAVLSHEIGHVVGRHAMNRIARLGMVVDLIDQAREANVIKDDQMAQKIADFALPILSEVDARTTYSRNEETEADLLGFYEMERAGWNPKGEVELLGHLVKLSPKHGPLATFISTHPDTAERLAIVEQEYKAAEVPSGLRDDSLQFRTMKIGLSLGR